MARFDRQRRHIRRTLIGALATVLALPATGVAQPAGPTRRKVVAVCEALHLTSDSRPRQWWASEFAKHGLVDGKDVEIVMIRRRAYQEEDFVSAVRQAVGLGADLIMTFSLGALAEGSLLPITRDSPLIVWAPDMDFVAGLENSIDTLNRRGENLTGAMFWDAELLGKELELMKGLRPRARRFAILVPANWVPTSAPTEATKFRERITEANRAVARRLELEAIVLEFPTATPVNVLMRELRKARIDVAYAESLWGSGQELWDALAASGIATLGPPEAAKEGALVGSGSIGYLEIAVKLAARVLRGARASSLPVERVRERVLAINLRTARRLGITVPHSVLLQADQVFE